MGVRGLGLLLALAIVSAPGCLLLTEERPRLVPDPDDGSLVAVVEVRGVTVVLADGRTYPLAGVETADLSDDQLAELHEALRAEVLRQRALIVPEKDGTARVQVSSHAVRPVARDWPVIVLLPAYYDVPATRADVAEKLISRGAARARPADLSDPRLAARYAAMEDSARKRSLGVWATPARKLVQAVQAGDAGRVRRLLSGGGIDLKSDAGGEAMYHAASAGNCPIARLLLDAGADVDARDANGSTPLFQAAARNHVALARLLVERGGQVNAGNQYGLTPLHLAGGAEVAAFLLDHAADVNARDNTGRTPLWHARTARNAAVVKLLRDRGGTE